MVIISEEIEESTRTSLADGGQIYILVRVEKSTIRNEGPKYGLKPKVQSDLVVFRLLIYEKEGMKKILFSRRDDVDWTFRLMNSHQVCVSEKTDHIINLP